MRDPDWNRREKKSPLQAFLTGLGMCLLFGLLWNMTGIGFFIFPLVFAGIIPAIEGFKRIKFNKDLEDRLLNKGINLIKRPKRLPPEKQLLRIAQAENGLVTPAIIALKTDIPMEKAAKMLDDMVRKGHVVMNVTEQGRVLYEFPEFKLQNHSTLSFNDPDNNL